MKQDEQKNYPPTESFIVREERDGPLRTKETHPSYGVVGISRVSGRAPLFASDTVHHHFIALRIKEASRNMDGTYEHIMGQKELIEVWMTEAQFAQMITQPNVGDGVPCTVHRVANEHWDAPFGARPPAPEPAPFLDGYKKEVGENAAKVSTRIAEAQSLVDDLLAGKLNMTKKNLDQVKQALYFAKMTADSNLPYVVERMHDNMEKRVARATVEFECYVSQSLAARGLAQMQQDAPQLKFGPQSVKELPAKSLDVDADFDAKCEAEERDAKSEL